MKRLFLGVPVSDGVKAALVPLLTALKLTGVQCTYVAPENLHFTLKFLGNVQEDLIDEICRKVEEALGGLRKFPMRLQGVGFFDTRSAPLWVGVENSGLLVQVMSAINEQLHYRFPEEREEMPHLTIARVKWGSRKKEFVELLEKSKEEKFGEMVVENVVLYESTLTSQGPVYGVVREFWLG